MCWGDLMRLARPSCFLALLLGCGIPTDFRVATPTCPFPPPLVTDTLGLPLGCPYRLDDSTVVVVP